MIPAFMLGKPSALYILRQILAQGLSVGTPLGSNKFLKGELKSEKQEKIGPHHNNGSLYHSRKLVDRLGGLGPL